MATAFDALLQRLARRPIHYVVLGVGVAVTSPSEAAGLSDQFYGRDSNLEKAEIANILDQLLDEAGRHRPSLLQPGECSKQSEPRSGEDIEHEQPWCRVGRPFRELQLELATIAAISKQTVGDEQEDEDDDVQVSGGATEDGPAEDGQSPLPQLVPGERVEEVPSDHDILDAAIALADEERRQMAAEQTWKARTDDAEKPVVKPAEKPVEQLAEKPVVKPAGRP